MLEQFSESDFGGQEGQNFSVSSLGYEEFATQPYFQTTNLGSESGENTEKIIVEVEKIPEYDTTGVNVDMEELIKTWADTEIPKMKKMAAKCVAKGPEKFSFYDRSHPDYREIRRETKDMIAQN